MKHYLLIPFAFVFCIGSAKADVVMPTHCKAVEYSVTNAWMGPIKATEGGWRNTKDGKFLSLCADKQIEPFGKLAYRYGALGKVEFEAVATESRQFHVFNRQTSPHTADDIIYFSSGDYTYYVAIAAGQGHGVSLRVYRGKKLILDRFSGNAENDDYSVGPAEINFFEVKSRILKLKEPAHDF